MLAPIVSGIATGDEPVSFEKIDSAQVPSRF